MKEKELSVFARAFLQASSAKELEDPTFEESLYENANTDQMLFIQSSTEDLLELKEMLGDDRDASREYSETVIALANFYASLHLRTSGFNSVAALMPEGARTQNVSDAYKEKGALYLAAITR